MKTAMKGLMGAALLAAVAAAPAWAQTQSWGFGLHTGYLNTGSLGEGEPDDVDLKLNSGWMYGGNLEWWLGSRRLGLHFDGAYTRQPYRLETGEHEPTWITNTSPTMGTTVIGLDSIGKVDTWFADASLMLRLLNPSRDGRFAPFISLGGGFARWDHEGEMSFDVQEADTHVNGEDQSEWTVTGSLGADVFMTRNIALRLEVKDYWNNESPYTFLADASRKQESAHNVVGRFGLQFLFGGAREEEPGFIAVTPAPAPAPVVTAPPPPPAPTTESVAMCVVDSNGRLQIVNATRTLSNRQVYVTRNGQQVAFSTVYPTTEPLYIRGAPWYVAARPLILDLDADDMGGDVDDEIDDAIENSDNLPANRIEFVNFGSTQPLPMGDVLYVGSMDGTPLYAKRTDIGGLLPDLESRLRVSTDLDDVLDDEAFADRFVNEIETFYLAVEPGSTNCVFQPVSSTRVVRRTRG